MFDVPVVGWGVHKFIIIKSFIVLSSWIFGYFGMKHLPLTIVGPINATRPVMVLVGAMLVFGERLNLYQWIGVMLAVLSFFMLSRSGKKEGIDFKHNKWILFIVQAAVTGAVSGLYDKYLMKQLPPMVVQSWYNIYQVFIMCPIILLLWYPKRKERNNHTATSYHRYDRNHGILITQGIEIHKVCCTKKDGYTDDSPIPTERCTFLSLGIPQQTLCISMP